MKPVAVIRQEGERPRMPTLSQIAVHPIKALDPVERDRVGITDVGGLDGDRAFAIVDASGNYVNGKRTSAVHRLAADVDLDAGRVVLGEQGTDERHEFDIDGDRDALEAWLSEFFGDSVTLETGPGGSLTDSAIYGDGTKTGPTLVSAATLREVASWFDGIDPAEMRLRLRPNLVVEGVPAFWEDRLVGEGGHLRIGGVRLEATGPLPRCVVPTRDPHTGEEYDGFRETFLEHRERTLPEWVDRSVFDGNLFHLTVGLRIPESARDGKLCVGDEVQRRDG